MCNIQQQIDEKIAIGKKLIAENEGVKYMTFHIENIDPAELKYFADEINSEPDAVDNKLRLYYGKCNNVTVFIYSKPVKITTKISYEFI